MEPITLVAPLSGRLMPLESVPDPVFAQKMAGDGIALDPTSNALLAPCDGQVIQLHPGQHAVTISVDGIEIVLHIGLDTALLKGEGFLAHIQTGDLVKMGDTLIEFDPDYLAANAASLLTLITIANSDRVAEFYKAAGDVQAGKDVLMELTPAEAPALPAAGTYKPIISETIIVPNHNGLHIRPAAVLASLARGFKSELRLLHAAREANAKSVTSIMALNAGHEAQVRLSAAGPDAYEAINILTPAIINSLGQGATPIQAPASTILPAIAAPVPRPFAGDPNRIHGVTAVPGLAIGHAYQLRPQAQQADETAGDPIAERQRLDKALAQEKLHMEALRAQLQAQTNPANAALFAAQHELLDDPELLEMAYDAIEHGQSAAFAWQSAIAVQARRLQNLDNDLLQLRTAVLRDAGARVANRIKPLITADPHLLAGSILIAEDLPAANLAALQEAGIQGFATILGGPTSDTAARARSLRIAAIAGAEARALDIPNGTFIILDASSGLLHLNPATEDIAGANARLKQLKTEREQNLAGAFQAARTADNHQIQVLANIATVPDAQEAMKLGADGIGLLPTETLFIDLRTPPTEDEQTAEYARIISALSPHKPLTIRALDSSSLMSLPFLPLARETNPALGQRGMRAALDQPHILRKQARAVLRASVDQGREIRFLLPMISTLDHWRVARDLISAEQSKMEIEPIATGLLIQAPATAVLAGQFAREADFLTIDADELAQYSLAMDHSHPRLAAQVDALNPAVLKLIELTLQGAAAHNKPVTITGTIAGDPQAIPILIGLGATQLSITPAAIPDVKAQIRALELAECRKLAQKAMAQGTAEEVRRLYILENN